MDQAHEKARDCSKKLSAIRSHLCVEAVDRGTRKKFKELRKIYGSLKARIRIIEEEALIEEQGKQLSKYIWDRRRDFDAIKPSKIIKEGFWSFVIEPQILSLNAGVRLEGERIEIRVPQLFLMKAEDLTSPTTKLGVYLKRCFKQNWRRSTEDERADLHIFRQMCKCPSKLEKAKKYILTHELAHVYHDDIYTRPDNDEESRSRETRADLTAAGISKDIADGGVYLAKSMYDMRTAPSHPSNPERVQYLKAYRDARYPTRVRPSATMTASSLMPRRPAVSKSLKT